MWVKICANTSLPDAQLAAELGADAVGFVLAPSKRQMSVAQVAAITPCLPPSVEKVGVFPAWEASELARAAGEAGLTAMQLHFGYRPELIRELNDWMEAHVKLIQVVSVPVEDPESAVAELRAAMGDPGLFAVLLDAARGGSSGGLGLAFSWDALAPGLHRARAEAAASAEKAGTALPRILLAGGLHAGNVLAAIGVLKPDGVDVASGVEAEPGRKSPEKLRMFLEAARRVSL